jgi:hypothetical protein
METAASSKTRATLLGKPVALPFVHFLLNPGNQGSERSTDAYMIA